MQASNGIHVPLGVYFRLAIEGKLYSYILFPNIYEYISEYYFQKSLYAYF